jgi:hypothetical protein
MPYVKKGYAPFNPPHLWHRAVFTHSARRKTHTRIDV